MKTSNRIAQLLLLSSCLMGAAGCKSGGPTTVQECSQCAQPPVQSSQMSLQQIVDMTHQPCTPQIIINQINNTGSNFLLTVDEIGWLKKESANDAVIESMQSRRTAAAPPPPPQTVVTPAAAVVPAYAPYPYPYAYPYGV